MNEGLNTLSAADVAAVTRNNDGNMWGDGGWFWIIILAFLFCGNGWGNNNGAQDAFISDEFVKRDIFNTNQNVSNTACETQRDVLEKTYVHGSIPCIPITPTEVHLSESLPQTKRLIRDVEEDMQHEKYYSDYQGCWS